MTIPTLYAGNKRTLYLGTQADAGTPLAHASLAIRVEEFTPNEVRGKTQLAETDRSTQEAADAVVAITPGFSFKCYLRPNEAAFFYQALLGSVDDSGGGPNYVHTINPDEETPWLTVFEEEPGVLVNRYHDVRVTQIEASGQNGGVIEATITCEALSFTAGATAPVGVEPVDELPFVYPESTTTKGGSAPGTVDQWQLTITRNATRAGGDVGFKSLSIVNGKFSVTGQITKFASDDDDQRQVDTGSTTGTTPTSDIFSETLDIKLARDADTSIEFAMPEVSWPTRTMATNTDGTPLAEVMGFRTLPQDDLADNITVTVKDQTPTADGTPIS